MLKLIEVLVISLAGITAVAGVCFVSSKSIVRPLSDIARWGFTIRGAVGSTIITMYIVFYLAPETLQGAETLSSLSAGIIVMLYLYYRRVRVQLRASRNRPPHHAP